MPLCFPRFYVRHTCSIQFVRTAGPDIFSSKNITISDVSRIFSLFFGCFFLLSPSTNLKGKKDIELTKFLPLFTTLVGKYRQNIIIIIMMFAAVYSDTFLDTI